MFSFRFWWLCNSKHTEGVPMAQLFATGIYTTIWTLPNEVPFIASRDFLLKYGKNFDLHLDDAGQVILVALDA